MTLEMSSCNYEVRINVRIYMNTFEINILGCGSAKPSLKHNPSCTVIDHRGTLYMVDCGEGAQKMFQQQRLKFSRLRHIFLTHLHGDHVLGLPGLIATMGLGGNGGKVTIHTFQEGKEILEKIISFFAPQLSFELEFNVIKPEESVILDTPSLTVRTIPLKHRVADVGFVFEEKPGLRHLRRDVCDYHQVPIFRFNEIKAGADFIKPDGTVIPNEVLTSPAEPARSYAHISDTRYMPDLAEKIGPVDLLFHETTYLDECQAEAKERFHSTAAQAATVARDAGVGTLLTGHYSSRYNDESGFLSEAKSIFPNTILSHEGLTLSIPLNK